MRSRPNVKNTKTVKTTALRKVNHLLSINGQGVSFGSLNMIKHFSLPHDVYKQRADDSISLSRACETRTVADS